MLLVYWVQEVNDIRGFVFVNDALIQWCIIDVPQLGSWVWRDK